MDTFRATITSALKKSFEAGLERHRVNVEMLLQKGVGLAEHPDVMLTLEEEIAKMAEYEDKLAILHKHIS